MSASYKDLYAFWCFVQSQIRWDPNIQYYCGAQTQFLKRVVDIWQMENPGVDRKIFEEALLSTEVAKNADIVRLTEERNG